MFVEKLKEQIGVNTPILTEEIFSLFPKYSRAQIFRYINQAISENELVKYCYGVYYIPRIMDFGQSSINADLVISKKYLMNNDSSYGILSGIALLNAFSITTQMAGVIEIVSTKESSKKRVIKIADRSFVVRKSRFDINKNNIGTYTILQLFTDLDDNDTISNLSKQIILNYCKEMNVTKAEIIKSSQKFPAKALRRLCISGVLDDIA